MALLKGIPNWRSSKSTDNVVNCLTVGLYDHDGAVMGSGKSAAPKTSSTASKKFLSFYFQNSATSGTSVGDYVKLTVSGIAGSGVAGRYFTYSNVAAALLVGAQISSETGAAGTVSGLLTGCRSQVLLADDATAAPAGTIAGGQSELYFNGDNSSTTDITEATSHSIHRFVLDGDTTARAKVQNAFEFVNVPVGTSTDTDLVNTTALTASHNMRVIINGDVYGILLDKY
jgi:hypothetical protein